MVVRIPEKHDPLRLAVLISGGGRTLLNLEEQIRLRLLPATIVQVISSRSNVVGVDRARQRKLPVAVVDRQTHDDASFQDRLTELIADADLVCMAGFLSLWRIPENRLGTVINVHPALLPAFGGKGMFGMRVHRAVIDSGVKESGCSIHYCDNKYDHGPVILQRRVAVSEDETPESLADKVFREECQAYPDVLEQFCRGEVPAMPKQGVDSFE